MNPAAAIFLPLLALLCSCSMTGTRVKNADGETIMVVSGNAQEVFFFSDDVMFTAESISHEEEIEATGNALVKPLARMLVYVRGIKAIERGINVISGNNVKSTGINAETQRRAIGAREAVELERIKAIPVEP